MTPSTSLVVSAILTFIMLLVASLARAKAWTPSGFILALGNRDNIPEPTPFAARADRAAKNMLESLVLFVALLLAASWAHVADSALAQPCAIFVYARIVFAFVYWAGIKYLRTLVWVVSITGLSAIARLVLA
jgi:uncharacterized MAPEG superfamily protein